MAEKPVPVVPQEMLGDQALAAEIMNTAPGPWSCVVEADQMWEFKNRTFQVTRVVRGRADAAVTLTSTSDGAVVTTLASKMCGYCDPNLPQWRRLPDGDDEGPTICLERTIVGLGPNE